MLPTKSLRAARRTGRKRRNSRLLLCIGRLAQYFLSPIFRPVQAFVACTGTSAAIAAAKAVSRATLSLLLNWFHGRHAGAPLGGAAACVLRIFSFLGRGRRPVALRRTDAHRALPTGLRRLAPNEASPLLFFVVFPLFDLLFRRILPAVVYDAISGSFSVYCPLCCLSTGQWRRRAQLRRRKRRHTEQSPQQSASTRRARVHSCCNTNTETGQTVSETSRARRVHAKATDSRRAKRLKACSQITRVRSTHRGVADIDA